MVTASVSTTDEVTARRPPLLPSEKNSNNVVPRNTQKKHSKSRHAPSSPLSSRRLSCTNDDSKQAEVSKAMKLLLTSSRRLAVSFQGESFSFPISKVRPGAPTSPTSRTPMPERRKTSANTKTTVNQGEYSSVVSKPDTVQSTVNRNAGSGNAVQLSLDLAKSEHIKVEQEGSDRLMAYDLDSASSGSIVSETKESNADSCNIAPGRAISARFWQETNSRLRRLQDPGLLSTRSPISKQNASSKVPRSTNAAPLSFPRSPSRGGITSPLSSPSRGNHSPSQTRNAVSKISTYSNSEPPSVLSFAREKVGEDRRDDAHSLRLLYNRHLQLRFMNARTEAVSVAQKRSSDRSLWNAWITISDLRDTVTRRRHRLQLLKQKLKLAFILRGQITSLEDWTSLDKEESTSLRGTMEALKTSTVRLPLVERATGNAKSLKDAIGSAAYVMEKISSSLYRFHPTVEEMNFLVTEIAKVTFAERTLLEQCTAYISLLEAMQVNESSLQTHILQHNQVATTRRGV